MRETLGIFAAFGIAGILIAASTMEAQTAAQSVDKPFVHPAGSGVWQADLDGIPAVTLTLADDAGQANGTIVFHAIQKDNGHAYSFSTDPHTLVHPRLDGNTMSFQVKRGNGSNEILNMAVQLDWNGNMQFPCANCGPQGTHAELQWIQ
jgi:hypothetical protein